jgi:hypothetical protein
MPAARRVGDAEHDADPRRSPDKEPTMTLDMNPTRVTTQTVCFAAPLLPGTSPHDRDEMLSCWQGERREEHIRSRRAHGITREAVWIQSTPTGDVATVLIESLDLAQALLGLATSQEPFDVWFREHLMTVHGMDLAAGMALPEQVLNFQDR